MKIAELIPHRFNLVNKLKTKSAFNQSRVWLNLGCSSVRLDQFVNVDIRHNAAADILADLNSPDFPRESADVVFSNAFFEHIFRSNRTKHLKSIFETLKNDGMITYIGLPYFPNIARAYLDGAPGIVGEKFDLYNVFRYTHGDPDGMPDWYFEQLHKSLFDLQESKTLLREAGFEKAVYFTYHYPNENLPVNFGFSGSKNQSISEAELREKTLDFLKRFDGHLIQLSTVQFVQ